MKRILLILLTCFSLTSFSQPLMGIISSSANNTVANVCNQNIILYSEQLDNAIWDKSEITVTTNQAADLLGNSTLELLTTTSTSAQIMHYNGGTYSPVLPNTTYRFSFEVKRGTMTDMKYSVYDRSNSLNIISSTSYYALTSSTVQRVSFTFTTPANCSKVSVYPLRNSGVTGTAYIGRVQLESNGSCYITTTSTFATP